MNIDRQAARLLYTAANVRYKEDFCIFFNLFAIVADMRQDEAAEWLGVSEELIIKINHSKITKNEFTRLQDKLNIKLNEQ